MKYISSMGDYVFAEDAFGEDRMYHKDRVIMLNNDKPKPEEYVFITKENCPYCTRAKSLAETMGHVTKNYDKDQSPDIVGQFAAISGDYKTFPRIYKKHEEGSLQANSFGYTFIGGYSEYYTHCVKSVTPK